MKNFILLIALILSTYSSLLSEDEDIKKALPLILSHQSAGTEFYLTFNPCWEETGPNNYVRIYVSSPVATKVTLEIEGLGLKQTQVTTIPNDVIEFKLAPTQGQMYSKTDRMPPQPLKVWGKRAVHITSDDPIVVYALTRYRYTSDGYLAMPVNALGKDYIVASWADPSNEKSQWLTSYSSVIGIYDSTNVTFRAGGGESTGNVLLPNNDTLRPNETTKTKLGSGDVWLLPSIGHFSDLSGSRIIADKPVAVISGNFCAYIPTWVSACDFIMEQEIPFEMYSNLYFVSPIADRQKNSWIKIFCKRPQTFLYRDGMEAGMLQTPGGTTGKGYLEQLADEGKPRGVVISSDPGYPIHIVQYNAGQSDDGVSSDPFQMNLVSRDLFQNEIVCNTPGIRGGYGFQKNFINLIFKKSDNGLIPDDLEIGTVSGGKIIWRQLNSIGGFYTAPSNFKYDDEFDGRPYAWLTIKLSGDGVYYFRSNDKIAAYAYGFAEYDSYGFPANFNPRTLEIKDTLKPSFELVNKDKKSIEINISDEPINDVVHRSNLGTISLISSQSENISFQLKNKIIPGQTSSANVILTSKDPGYAAKALVLAKDYAGNDTIFHYTIEQSNFSINKPVLISPINNFEDKVNSITFNWRFPRNAKYFRFELDDNSDFSSPYIYKGNIKDTFLLVSTLINDEINYWRIKAFNETDSSSYSDIWSFIKVEKKPLKPILILPLNFSSKLYIESFFQWNNPTNSKKYSILFSKQNTFDTIFKRIDDLTDTVIIVKGFEYDEKYYWKVIAFNELNQSKESETWEFSTLATYPEIPQLVSPPDNSIDAFVRVNFIWRTGLNHKRYVLEIDDNQNFSSINNTIGTTDTTYMVENLTESTKYYWRVTTFNEKNRTSQSEIWSFTTNSMKPAMAELIYPTDASTNIHRDAELLWMKNILNDYYQVQVAYDKEFKKSLYDTKINTNSFKVNLDKYTTYYWRVKSFNKFGESDWTPTRSFTTNDITSVLESELDKTTVSPNPAKDNIRISLNGNHKPNYIHLLNSKGELVDEIEFDGINNEINYNLAKIPSGEYNLLISYPNNTVVRKIVVIK